MIRFEIMTQNHIDEILNIEKKCFPGDEWSRPMFESEIDNELSIFIVGVDENKNDMVACYACIWLVLDIGDITNIAVAPDYRRQGLGEHTLQLLIDLSNENSMNIINLEVKEDNTPALNLYKKMGFVEVGKRKNYYKDNKNAILMTKYL